MDEFHQHGPKKAREQEKRGYCEDKDSPFDLRQSTGTDDDERG